MKTIILASFCLYNMFLLAADPAKMAAIEQAKYVGQAFMQRDYEYVIDKTYPGVLEIAGGRENMLELTRTEMDKLAIDSMYITAFNLGEAEKVIKGSKEWFCVIHKSLTIASQGMIVKTKGCLIGVSNDQGKNWSFVDGAGVTEETMDILFPSRPKKLKMPEQVTPDISFVN